MSQSSAKMVANNNECRIARRTYIRELKLESGCAVCGYHNCAKALDFHHKGVEKKDRNISTLANQQASWERINREIAKCTILCRNCHAELHDKPDR